MLEGLRIIEAEGLGPAPFAGMMLADMGADVIVVHRTQADSTPGKTERSLLDRGKRSIALDLKSPDDIGIFKRLVSTADGLIEGFRPGVMERLEVGPDDLFKVKSRLVYGRMTGWGQTGPRALQAGHDLNYIAASGALWYASPPGQPPFAPPTLVGDIGGGALYLVTGMLAGILRAQRTGEGAVVDAAMVDGSAHMMNLLLSLQDTGLLSFERGQSMLDGPHWSRCYACSDEQWLSVQCLEPKFYAIFLEKLGLSKEPAFADQFNMNAWPNLTARLSGIFAAKPLSHWATLFEGSDACVVPVNSPESASNDPHVAARGIWCAPHGRLQARAAPRFDEEPPPDPQPSPFRGEHTTEILSELEQGGD